MMFHWLAFCLNIFLSFPCHELQDFLKKTWNWGDGSVNECLLCKHETGIWIPGAHIKAKLARTCNTNTCEAKREEFWETFEFSERPVLNKQTVNNLWRHPTLTLGLYVYLQTYVPTCIKHIYIYTCVHNKYTHK